MPNEKGGINAKSFDGDSTGDAQRRQNAATEGLAGSAGPGSATGRTSSERQAAAKAVQRKPLSG